MLHPGIYAHIDPFSYEIRYIGKSTNWPKRSREHFRPSRLIKIDTHHSRWLKQLQVKNRRPIVMVVQEFTSISLEQLSKAEIYYISYFKQLGCPLTNSTEGGERHPISEETKAKIRAALIKPKHPRRPAPSHLSRVTSQSGSRAIQDQNGNTYLSIKECARTLGIKFTKIVDILHKRRNSYKGYSFIFL